MSSRAMACSKNGSKARAADYRQIPRLRILTPAAENLSDLDCILPGVGLPPTFTASRYLASN
jgi:hypothetical protein